MIVYLYMFVRVNAIASLYIVGYDGANDIVIDWFEVVIVGYILITNKLGNKYIPLFD